LRPWECGASGRWHIHCAIELPSHFDAITLENMIRECWAQVDWGHGRILVRDGANAIALFSAYSPRQILRHPRASPKCRRESTPEALGCFGATDRVGERPRSSGQTTAWPSRA